LPTRLDGSRHHDDEGDNWIDAEGDAVADLDKRDDDEFLADDEEDNPSVFFPDDGDAEF